MVRKISKIETQKRPGRYNIYLDGKYAFAVSEEILIRYRIAKGMEVDDELEQDIIANDDVSKLYSRSLDYLSHQLRAESEVRTKLQSISENVDAVEIVIQRLISENLLDDQNYADSYVRTMVLTSDKGPGVIKRNLISKKIPSNVVETSLLQIDSDQLMENGLKLANKQFKHYHNSPMKMRLQKVRTSMMTKGYQSDFINEIFEAAGFQADEDQQDEILAKQAEKLMQRNRKYEPFERNQRVKRNLVSKGFSFDDINRWFNENYDG